MRFNEKPALLDFIKILFCSNLFAGMPDIARLEIPISLDTYNIGHDAIPVKGRFLEYFIRSP